MDANELIDSLGGTSKVAELCEVSASAVSQWRAAGVPKPWRKYLQLMRDGAANVERPAHATTEHASEEAR